MNELFTPVSVLQSLQHLPAFPQIVSQVLATLDDDNSSLDTLVKHLQHDPVLAGRILAAANASSQHGHRALGGISSAVSFIRMRRIGEIVVTTSLLDLTRHTRGTQLFHEHCLAVGVAAQILAQHFCIDPDRALVAGLLHDIGKLWMSYLHPTQHQQVNVLVRERANSQCEIEREIFGMDHAAIGGIIARHWQLPEDIIEAIAVHHQPEHPELGKLAAIIHVAESICNGLDIPYRDDNQVVDISTNAMGILGMGCTQDMDDLFGHIDARFQHAQHIL